MLDMTRSSVSDSQPRRMPSERPGPPGGKRDRNRKERTEALLAAGLGLFLDRGLEAVTVDDIARAAGMAKGNFYRYFRDKDDLVDALFEPIVEEMRAAMRRCAEDLAVAGGPVELYAAYEALARSLAEAALPRPGVVRLYLQERRSPGVGARAPIRRLSNQIDEASIELSNVAVEHGLLRVRDPRISAYAVVGAVEELMLAVLQERLDAPPEEIIETLIGLVLDGIRAPQA
ncbi:MAG: TetR/AcrR family transcriptional regulator [Myxococcota bacterium]